MSSSDIILHGIPDVCSAGKVLIIGGGIANFTNVAATFKVSMEHSHQGSDPGMRLDSSHTGRP